MREAILLSVLMMKPRMGKLSTPRPGRDKIMSGNGYSAHRGQGHTRTTRALVRPADLIGSSEKPREPPAPSTGIRHGSGSESIVCELWLSFHRVSR